MHLRSDSFKPYDTLDARLAFGAHDPDSHVKLVDNRGLASGGDAMVGEMRKAMSQDLRELAHRIDIVRTLALPR